MLSDRMTPRERASYLARERVRLRTTQTRDWYAWHRADRKRMGGILLNLAIRSVHLSKGIE